MFGLKIRLAWRRTKELDQVRTVSSSASARAEMEAKHVTFYDVALHSVKNADLRRLAAELNAVLPGVSMDRLVSAEKAPLILARYAGPRAARNIRDSLCRTGAFASLQVSRVTCPHCGFSIECIGEPTALEDGVVFCCQACQGLTLLDLAGARFRSVRRCGSCGSLVELPDRPQSGTYSCSCGAAAVYVPPKQTVPLGSVRRRPRYSEFVLALSTLVLVAVLIDSAWVVSHGPAEERSQALLQNQATAAYRSFDARTDRSTVIDEIGRPDREVMTDDGKEQILFYRGQDIYVVMEKTASGTSYEATVRISDGALLHERPGS